MASLTRRIRSLIDAHHVPLRPEELVRLPVEPTLGIVDESLDLTGLPCHAGKRETVRCQTSW